MNNIFNLFKCLNVVFKLLYNFNGDWGLGIGDWGLGVWGQNPKPQTQNPNPQTPIKKKKIFLFLNFLKKLIKI